MVIYNDSGDKMKNLRKLRVEKGLKQEELADFLKIAKSTYSRYENDVRQPDNETLVKLANFFDVSVDYLLGNDIKRKRNTEANLFEKNKEILSEIIDDETYIVFQDGANLSPKDIDQIKDFVTFIKNKKK